ncbi:DAK2 domain-containing protein [Peptoniphilus obesi]|uniref:DAK2 domain-containing protein n=1 Tax=Peptoniphilus obesi TaxID=1472765 RepID=UPI0004AC8138|nr:DAK2 domain-containing protein [Peptoniphilus obesi]
MSITKIDGNLLAKSFTDAVNYLVMNKDEVNALNVFPVPDGDTGTNMSLTAKSSLKQINNLEDKSSISEVSKAIARGSLMGARGNSGVILSQYLRGFSEGLDGIEEASVSELANAFKIASETTYKAVMKPTEGTILTVGREMSEFASRNSRKYDDIVSFMEDFVEAGEISLSKTPEKLQVLKEAGVVDAGGKGLLVLITGILRSLKGENFSAIEDEQLTRKAQKDIYIGELADDDIEFGYCTEFVISTKNEDVDGLRNKIAPLGDCLLVVGGGGSGIIKVHVHTNNPGKVLEYAVELGALQDIKIDNMRLQHQEVLFKKEEVEKAKQKEIEDKKTEETQEKKKYSFIVVSLGKGINEVFKSLGADQIVEGGQTMNPSTEDLVKSVEKAPSDNVFIIPNNSNIILAANQAKDLCDKNVAVVETKSIAEGVTAILSFSEDLSIEENLENMTAAIEDVVSAEVTYAVRDTNMDGKQINKGDIIGLSGKKILAAGSDTNKVTEDLIDQLVNDETSMISIYWGHEIDKDKSEELYNSISEKYDDLDVDLIEGDQPLYYYLIALE